MKIYNTLTKSIEELIPLQPPEIKVYTCGPTVYDYTHIGHWFNYVRMDTLIRVLKLNNFIPIWVMNITDVGHLTSDADEGEDKLEKGAKREGKTAWEIANFYTNDFIAGLDELNITKPDFMPKATDHINDQINLIKRLEDKGVTYIIENDGIYFDTYKVPNYAEFARLNLAEQQEGARVGINKLKRNPWDFALWKFSPSDRKRDMEWDSPWGKGFPGWHIECSAMSMKYLGESLDIHTGGIDHIPIHHTNEIAQSETATGKRFANYWFHSNHVLFDNQKISKSLGNTIKLSDLKGKGFSSDILRLHILESHYRNQSTFNYDSLEAAKNRLDDLKALSALRYQPSENVSSDIEFNSIQSELLDIASNDLNTPKVLANLSELCSDLLSNGINNSKSDEFSNFIDFLDQLLGLNLAATIDINNQQKELISDRSEARSSGDWHKSDELRDQLSKQGIGLRDTDGLTIWYPL